MPLSHAPSRTSSTLPADATTLRAPLFRQPLPALPARQVSAAGFVRAMRNNGLQLWTNEAYEAGYVEERLFHQKRVLLNQPEMIHRVLVENHNHYARTEYAIRLIRPIGRYSLMLATGEQWKHQRRTITPTLAPKMLPVLARHVAACTEDEVRSLAAQDGAPVNLLPVMQSLALKIAARSMFSLEIREYGPAVRAAVQEFMQRHTQASFAELVMPYWVPTPRDVVRNGFRKRWLALVDQIIDARERQPADDAPRDLFDALLAARDPHTGAAFSRVELADQIGTMIVAGHEPSGLTLLWALYLLANVPDAQAALAGEVRDVDLSPERAGDALQALPYTRAVIDETLRLYPPAWVILRRCVEPDQLEGLAVTRGTHIMISPWVLHHHRGYWQNPDAFDPARFLPGAPQPARFTYLPFGTGPRVCVGAQFTLAETTLALARLVQAFDVQLASDEPVLPVGRATTVPDRPVLFRMKPR
ncbi:cytochrome P450 [Paraburkholderia solisilvae]|uniref:Pentalenene oxygenase n=1 Tax=Paraburkholderia solisilvae TaxID=624376 RepID=A0A6J5EA08_9BURK|nr:cytochrome P450 [Paraburkholderia solisilvae]CAB3761992.1 Pentalenene oxygenase [Paraburkholderia solisilvae]